MSAQLIVPCPRCGSADHYNDCPRFPGESTTVSGFTQLDRARLEACYTALVRIETMIQEIRDTVNSVIPEVKPALDQVMASPIIRLMTGGKK